MIIKQVRLSVLPEEEKYNSTNPLKGFKSQAMLLSRMFYFIESGKIQDPIYSPEQAPIGTSNKDFLQKYVADLLQTAFKNLQE